MSVLRPQRLPSMVKRPACVMRDSRADANSPATAWPVLRRGSASNGLRPGRDLADHEPHRLAEICVEKRTACPPGRSSDDPEDTSRRSLSPDDLSLTSDDGSRAHRPGDAAARERMVAGPAEARQVPQTNEVAHRVRLSRTHAWDPSGPRGSDVALTTC